MKVLQVIDRVEAGGAERVFLDMTEMLIDKGVQVETLCISAKGKLYDKIDSRAKTHFLNRRNKFSISTMWRCAKLCANFDLVHVHMRHTYGYVRLAQLISLKKFKIIFHDHFSLNHVPFNLKSIFKPTYYIGVCMHNIEWARNNLYLNPSNIFLLSNTIKRKVFNDVPNKLVDSIVIVSNIRPIKNIELAINVAEKMNKKMTIIGNNYDLSYYNLLNSKISLNNNIEILQNIENVQFELLKHTLGLHTSNSETGPLVLLEYLAQGLPFVAYQTGEVAHVLKEIIPQCFVNSLDENEWIEAIKNIEQNPPSAAYLKSLFETYFGPEKYINQCLAIYQQVVNS